jgi:hypothetical protein
MNFAIGQPEETSRVTPLGLRFYDTLTGQTVREGLIVTAYSVREPSRGQSPILNRSGIYVFQDLPGIRDAEFGAGDDPYWTNVTTRAFIIDVMDRLGRFQPFRVQVDLPYKGLLTNPCALASPLLETDHALGIPLYSAVTRVVPSGNAVIYASLWDEINARPASWARVEAHLEGKFLMPTFADAQGQVALLFPYPEPFHTVFPPLTSPLLGQRPPLVDQTWPIQLDVYYRNWNPIPNVPDLCEVFDQPACNLMSTLSPNTRLIELVLPYGKPVVLRTGSRPTISVLP